MDCIRSVYTIEKLQFSPIWGLRARWKTEQIDEWKGNTRWYMDIVQRISFMQQQYTVLLFISFHVELHFTTLFFCVCSILEFHRFPVVIFLNPILNIYELINCHGADIVQYKIWNLVWSTIVLNQVFISIWLASFNPFWTAWHRSEGANRQKFRGNLNLLKCTYVEMIQS